MDARARKQTLRSLSNGMYIVTSAAGPSTGSGQGPCYGAATVTWLSQASFKPPLVMAAIRPDSNVFKCLAESGGVAVHVLDSTQQDMAFRFFSPTRVADGTINGEPFTHGVVTGAPILTNAAAYFEGLVRRMVPLGDHVVVIMEVIDADCRRALQPLTVAASPWEYGG